MQERHQVGRATQQPLQQFLLWAGSTCIPSGAYISYLKLILKTKFPNVDIWSSVSLDARPRGSQPAARRPSSRCVAGHTDVLSDWGARCLAPFFCHIRPTLKVALNSPAEEREYVTVRTYVKKNDTGNVRNAGVSRCMYLDISWYKQRKTEKVERGLFVAKGIASVNRSLFSFCVRWCRLCCFPHSGSQDEKIIGSDSLLAS